MAPSKLRKAIGAVKDRTSISLAKVSNSHYFADLDVAILKATRHEEYPADERYIREIISMTLCSRSHVSSCVNSISKRLNKTKNWTVALKTLMLIQRLLSEGDSGYEREMFYATRRGTRLLNMSDFRDHTKSGSWDYSAYVRTYALYLDERLEFRMHNRRRRRGSLGGEDDDEEIILMKESSPIPTTPVHEMKTDQIFSRTQHLQQLLERFLACRPTGPAKNNRVVLASLYPIVKESFQIYYDIAEIMNILIERFMDLEIRDCTKVHEMFIRMSKQFDELDTFYQWCKAVGVARSSEYPEVDKIEQKKIDLMDEFKKDKMILAQCKRGKNLDSKNEAKCTEHKVPKDTNKLRASPPPPEEICEEKKEEKKEEIKQTKKVKVIYTNQQQKLLDIGDTQEETKDKLALILIDVGTPRKMETSAPEWVAFTADNSVNWETSLVQSTSVLNKQNPNMGGGFDKLLLDGMYQESTKATTLREAWGPTGSASSLALGSNGNQQTMLALPAPPVSNKGRTHGFVDPFSASLSVAPPAYVQMSEMEMKQKILVEEQQLWHHYARDGRKGRISLQQFPYGMESYNHSYQRF
ncbi:hypothetical protein FRX31_003682 [Thalictrum thalictroides]|uniref:ENTH domain-containing protein n=1 Tax=Thalictrum thalictroides TaxID=46969 RepID=A0A7J6XAB6_THATH|nr:hypothetical protein FRX31_003682 [Thalictrum thalictroides]